MLAFDDARSLNAEQIFALANMFGIHCVDTLHKSLSLPVSHRFSFPFSLSVISVRLNFEQMSFDGLVPINMYKETYQLNLAVLSESSETKR